MGGIVFRLNFLSYGRKSKMSLSDILIYSYVLSHHDGANLHLAGLDWGFSFYRIVYEVHSYSWKMHFQSHDDVRFSCLLSIFNINEKNMCLLLSLSDQNTSFQ